MAQQKFTNNATSKLAGSLTNVATSLSVTATEGAKFPSLGAGEWFMVNLVKLVGGLPVIEIVKVTARATDTFTIVRAQESTLATTFSAGDVVDLRITAGTMDNAAQRGGDNTFTGTTAHVGTTTVPTVAPGDNSTNAASTAHVQASYAKKGANSDITSLAGLTTPLSIAQGGTSQTTGPLACNALGAVQNGTGVGQGTNIVKLGWATTTGGLKATVDTTDQGFIPFVTGNPSSGSDIVFNGPRSLQIGNSNDAALMGYTGTGAITQMRLGGVGATPGVAHKFDRTTGNYTIGYGNAGSETNRLQMDSGGTLYAMGGGLLGLGTPGMFQTGSTGGLNIAYDYTQIQARNNGAAATLNLNNNGGLVQVGGGGLSTSGSGALSGDNVIARNIVQVQSAGPNKIQLMTGGTTNGYIQSNGSQCFVAVNASNTIQAFYADNSGNCTAAGNITANSDVTLKKNWRAMVPDFLDRMADVQHGVYDRIDTGITQAGLSAQDVQAICPELVTADARGILSLAYGQLGALIGVKLAQRAKQQQQEINDLKALVATLIKKVGNA